MPFRGDTLDLKLSSLINVDETAHQEDDSTSEDPKKPDRHSRLIAVYQDDKQLVDKIDKNAFFNKDNRSQIYKNLGVKHMNDEDWAEAMNIVR